LRFRAVEFQSFGRGPTDKEIKAIESAVGARLPREFKTFLRDANGAEIPYAIFVDTEEIEESLNFHFWFHSDEGHEDGFLPRLALARERWSVPAGILPFARDWDGAMACLDLRPERRNEVVALLVDTRYVVGPLVEPPFVQVASTFLEYMDRLVPELSPAAFGLDEDGEVLE